MSIYFGTANDPSMFKYRQARDMVKVFIDMIQKLNISTIFFILTYEERN